jgi:hypothetical protein
MISRDPLTIFIPVSRWRLIVILLIVEHDFIMSEVYKDIPGHLLVTCVTFD